MSGLDRTRSGRPHDGTTADAITARFPLVNPHGPWAGRQPVIEAFAAAQVAARKDMTIDEVRGEWAGHLPLLVNMLRGAQPFPPVDTDHQLDGGLRLAAHNHDLCGALELPGDRDSPAVALSLRRYVAGLSQRIVPPAFRRWDFAPRAANMSPVTAPPASPVTTTRWELFRALCSRRSESQIRAYRWTGDPDVYVPLLGAYGLPGVDLIE